MKVFVTGATGVLGRRVVPALLRTGHEVTAVSRTDAKAEQLRRVGAKPVVVDLFDPDQVREAISGHDAVCHLATHIPTGADMPLRRGWRTNDRLRRQAAGILSSEAIAAGIERYVGESITFPYVDSGDAWIDEQTSRDHNWVNETTTDAEAAAQAVSDAGGSGVSLRFAMFSAPDSDHMATYRWVARLGISPLFGAPDSYISFIDIDDAAEAVVSALGAAPGVYNIAERNPTTRERHGRALADAIGRRRLRAIPDAVIARAGDNVAGLARSQRIDACAFADETGWTQRVDPIDRWNSGR